MGQRVEAACWWLDRANPGWRDGHIDETLYTGTEGDDRLHGRKTTDTIDGLEGDDVLNGRDGDDTLDGGAGRDVLKGSGGYDHLDGGEGDDVLYGGTERQEHGGGGVDRLFGGDGDDRLFGGFQSDELTGGSGSDRFAYRSQTDSTYRSPDSIKDFEQGSDELVFGEAFRQAGDLHFIGDAMFSGTPGEVRSEVFSTSTGVLIDLDGDAKPDMRIIFPGPEIHFQASDFSF